MTTALTTQQQQEVATLLKGFENVTPEIEAMAIRCVMQKANDAQKPASHVERRIKCSNGHTTLHLIELQFDEETGEYARNERGHVHGWATCEICDTDFYTYIRLSKND